MRPDIDAGPIERKCSVSNGPPPATPADEDACAKRPAIDGAPNAANSATASSINTRNGFMADSGRWCSGDYQILPGGAAAEKKSRAPGRPARRVARILSSEYESGSEHRLPRESAAAPQIRQHEERRRQPAV